MTIKNRITLFVLLLITFVLSTNTAWAARTTSYQYNSFGQVTQIDGPRTDVLDITAFVYDASGNLTSITNALGQVTNITAHDAHGRPLTIMDPNTVSTVLAYDLRGRLLSRTVGGQITTFAYDGVGNITQLTLPTGAFIQYTYDAAQRLIGITDNLGNKIDYSLDAAGNRTKDDVKDPLGLLTRTQSRVFNSLSQLTQVLGGVNQSTSYVYDANGNPITLTDGLTNPTNQAFDALNRLTDITDAAQGLTKYTYDARDNLTSVKDPNGNITNYTYDGLDNLTQQVSPDTGTTNFTHDDAGNVLSQTDARSISVNFAYDALNRLTTKDFVVNSLDVTLSYDTCPNGIGRLCQMSDASGSTSYAYDARGNVIQTQSIMDGITTTIGYAYNGADQVTQTTYPSTRTVDFTHNSIGQIASVASTFNSVIQSLASSITYEPFGPMNQLTYGNRYFTTRNYDLEGRLDTITLPRSTAPNQLPEVSIATDPEGETFLQGSPLTVIGVATDVEDGNLSHALNWSSNLDGILGTGESLTLTTLSLGIHTITASVSDSQSQTGSASVTTPIVSEAGATAPMVVILTPTNGISVMQGQAITFTGTATDTDDGDLSASVGWRSNLDGLIGTGASVSLSTLTIGTHTITAQSIDSDSLIGTATVAVTIMSTNGREGSTPPPAPNQLPEVSIATDPEGETFLQGSPLTVIGVATDAEDGNLSHALNWSSNLDGILGTGESLTLTTLSLGVHTITASVSDSQSRTGSASVTTPIVSGAGATAPTVVILTPTNGISVMQGQTVTFTGTATDTDDGDLSASVSWRSNLDGLIGTGASINFSTLRVGPHTITAQSTDSDGLIGTATLAVTVMSATGRAAWDNPFKIRPTQQIASANKNAKPSFMPVVDVTSDKGSLLVIWPAKTQREANAKDQFWYIGPDTNQQWLKINAQDSTPRVPQTIMLVDTDAVDLWQKPAGFANYQHHRIALDANALPPRLGAQKVSHTAPNLGLPVQTGTQAYHYDANGNILDITTPQGDLNLYSYDALNRLFQDALANHIAIDYGYDANGNRISETQGTSSQSYNYQLGSNILSDIDGSSRTYDATGNLTSDQAGNRTLTYNEAGRLSQVHVSGVLTATYTYNGLGQRVKKVTASATTYYHYDLNGQLIGETDATGAAQREYVHLNGEPLAQMDVNGVTESITYLHPDHLGTPRRGTDQTGTLVWYWESEAFGEEAASGTTTVNLRFSGQYFDQETNLHQNYFRYYDPATGRYITSDPIGLNGGLNTYAYVDNNPLYWIDPLGLIPPGSIPGFGSNRIGDPLPDSSGIAVNASTVNPFTSGGGGAYGLNWQSFYDSGESDLYKYSSQCRGAGGLDVGVAVESVWAWGSGEWSGDFNSFNGNIGPIVGSVFWSPGEGGWFGFTLGLGVGLPGGAAYEETTYSPSDSPSDSSCGCP